MKLNLEEFREIVNSAEFKKLGLQIPGDVDTVFKK